MNEDGEWARTSGAAANDVLGVNYVDPILNADERAKPVPMTDEDWDTARSVLSKGLTNMHVAQTFPSDTRPQGPVPHVLPPTPTGLEWLRAPVDDGAHDATPPPLPTSPGRVPRRTRGRQQGLPVTMDAPDFEFDEADSPTLIVTAPVRAPPGRAAIAPATRAAAAAVARDHSELRALDAKQTTAVDTAGVLPPLYARVRTQTAMALDDREFVPRDTADQLIMACGLYPHGAPSQTDTGGVILTAWRQDNTNTHGTVILPDLVYHVALVPNTAEPPLYAMGTMWVTYGV